MTANLLLIDDDSDYSEVTAYALRRAGFDVVIASAGTEARTEWSDKGVDIVLVNPQLGDASGLEMCRLASTAWGVPVVALSASRKEEDVLEAFSAGVDDYVIKPYSMKQLVARIEAIHRRAAAQPLGRTPRLLTVGEVNIDHDAFTVTVGEIPAHLTRQEFLLLHVLAANAGKVVALHRLVEYAWDDITAADPGLVKTLLSRVRRKLQDAGCSQVMITAIPRVGYRLEARREVEDATHDDVPAYLRRDALTEEALALMEDVPLAEGMTDVGGDLAQLWSTSSIEMLSGQLAGRMEETLAMLKTYRESMKAEAQVAG